jgi:hypothetical protein
VGEGLGAGAGGVGEAPWAKARFGTVNSNDAIDVTKDLVTVVDLL